MYFVQSLLALSSSWVGVPYNHFHHGLQIYKIYNIDWLVYIPSCAWIGNMCPGVLSFGIYCTRVILGYSMGLSHQMRHSSYMSGRTERCVEKERQARRHAQGKRPESNRAVVGAKAGLSWWMPHEWYRFSLSWLILLFKSKIWKGGKNHMNTSGIPYAGPTDIPKMNAWHIWTTYRLVG